MQTIKYTPEQTTQAVASYAEGNTPEQIAHTLGKSTKSVIAKLVREGVYVAQPKVQPKLRKLDLVEVLAAQLELDPAQLQSLEKAQHSALELIVNKLQQL